ncbi:AN1-type zinc finger domain-containing protein [Halorussus pelagicus]|uniref:AN1-type zinc finger domain-containing protein n=1 Tax=Halorussus pelagicus TaxID=2505977 RepID=UPI000FFBC6B0
MAECDYCGTVTEHAFPCNYCESSFCGDHRLPENHDCTRFHRTSSGSSLSGNGPDTSDRRSTHRTRVERVREKETTTMDRRVPDTTPNTKNNHQEDKAELKALSCPTCGSNTATVQTCDSCGQSTCPDCDHDCNLSDEPEEERDSLINRIKRFLSV